ncbi:DUF1799 domain-containing protein [Castellaniella ginsengisoli]|uniref:DUF1799 domain-containing protein n=1 Tax=Castellaniella ginsengisoli TaxID=546114 RepID=A0AB39EQR1_9BURK
MKFLYDRPPSAAELAEFGVRPSDFPPRRFEVWPENWTALDLYVRNRSQWIQGRGGPTGLNYPWFRSCLDRQGLPADEAETIMDGIRVIEDAVLDEVYKDR